MIDNDDRHGFEMGVLILKEHDRMMITIHKMGVGVSQTHLKMDLSPD